MRAIDCGYSIMGSRPLGRVLPCCAASGTGRRPPRSHATRGTRPGSPAPPPRCLPRRPSGATSGPCPAGRSVPSSRRRRCAAWGDGAADKGGGILVVAAVERQDDATALLEVGGTADAAPGARRQPRLVGGAEPLPEGWHAGRWPRGAWAAAAPTTRRT